ncbi:nitroreductase family protein [Nocardia sp. NPDC047654]|uniref:nitroreductase family protein n=1 Tax=Nocardia sp. NPDC047654 TaxID=3364314 RepID=UPI00371B7220
MRSRQSIRAFTDRPVPRDVLDRVLAGAARTPSGGNLQPWHIYILTGDRLTELQKRIAERVAAGDSGGEPEFAFSLSLSPRYLLHGPGTGPRSPVPV